MASPTPWSILAWVNRLIYDVFTAVCGVLLAILVTSVTGAVFFRYVVALPLPWGEEVAVYSFIWTVLLGTSLGVKDHTHLVADLLPERLPGIWDKALVVFIHLMSTIVALLFLWYGYDYAILGLTRYSVSMDFPMFYIYVSMPIAGAAMLLFLIEKFYEAWRGVAR